MALTGLDIYKLLPQTNCGDCGVPTCLAFAMKVASKQAAVDECPHVSDEAQNELGAASAPPQKLVTVGTGDKKLQIGNETVMFRHEEKFHHPPGIAVMVDDSEDVEEKAEKIAALHFERIGEEIFVDTVALNCSSGDGGKLLEAARKLHDKLGFPLVLMAADQAPLCQAGEELAELRPLLYQRGGPGEDLVATAAEKGLPLVVEGDLESCDAAAQEAKEAGVEEMVLCPGAVKPAGAVEFMTLARRAALQKNHRPMGYPTLVQAGMEDPALQSMEACRYVAKYAGIVVLTVDSPEYVLPVLTMRQSIYIDPQVPVQVEPGIYEINEPDAKAPLLVTTNFSLTYYSVLSEVESSRVPVRILAVDTEGTSVLTAWAADKFGAEQVNEAFRKTDALEKLDEGHRKPVIPGLVAVISGELQEESGCDVLVGPKEASGLPKYLKNEWDKLVG